MKLRNWIKAVLLIGIILLIVAGCTNKKNKESQAVHPQRDTVYIENMKFNPAELTINAWDTVVWVNNDIVAHDVTVYPDKTWSSDTLHTGQSWHTTIEVSTDYFCSIHPTMTGKITVKERDGD